MLRGSEPAGKMNIGSEKFGALQEISPINFYEAKIWISDTFLRKWGDIKVNLTQWHWSEECQENNLRLEKERCGRRSHIWWGMRVIIFFLDCSIQLFEKVWMHQFYHSLAKVRDGAQEKSCFSMMMTTTMMMIMITRSGWLNCALRGDETVCSVQV